MNKPAELILHADRRSETPALSLEARDFGLGGRLAQISISGCGFISERFLTERDLDDLADHIAALRAWMGARASLVKLPNYGDRA